MLVFGSKPLTGVVRHPGFTVRGSYKVNDLIEKVSETVYRTKTNKWCGFYVKGTKGWYVQVDKIPHQIGLFICS